MSLFSFKTLQNVGWLTANQLILLLVGALVGIFIARTLGPEDYGLFSYSKAFISIFYIVCTLNLSSVVVRELVGNNGNTSSTLATCLVIHLMLGILLPVLCLLAVRRLTSNDHDIMLVASIFALTIPLTVREIFIYWFEAQSQARNIFLGMIPACLLAAGFQVWLLLVQPSVAGIVLIMVLEMAFSMLVLMLLFSWKGPKVKLFDARLAKAGQLLKEGLPLAVGLITMSLVWRADQLMLGWMLDTSAVGHYSICLNIVNLIAPVFGSLLVSIYPAMVDILVRNPERAAAEYQRVYDLVTPMAFAIALVMSLFARPLTVLVFGPEYAESAGVMAIFSWVLVLWVLGMTSSRWFIAHRMSSVIFYRSITGVVINVLLNLMFIPAFGMEGAAVATLIAFFVSCFLLDLLSPRTRIAFFHKTRALSFLWLWRLLAASVSATLHTTTDRLGAGARRRSP